MKEVIEMAEVCRWGIIRQMVRQAGGYVPLFVELKRRGALGDRTAERLAEEIKGKAYKEAGGV